MISWRTIVLATVRWTNRGRPAQKRWEQSLAVFWYKFFIKKVELLTWETVYSHIFTQCTDQSLNQMWTDHIWGPGGSCLWAHTDVHKMGPPPPASVCDSMPSGGIDTGKHPHTVADIAGRVVPRLRQWVPTVPMYHLGHNLPLVLSEL